MRIEHITAEHHDAAHPHGMAGWRNDHNSFDGWTWYARHPITVLVSGFPARAEEHAAIIEPSSWSGLTRSARSAVVHVDMVTVIALHLDAPASYHGHAVRAAYWHDNDEGFEPLTADELSDLRGVLAETLGHDRREFGEDLAYGASAVVAVADLEGACEVPY